MNTFKACRVFNENNKIESRIVDLTLDDLAPGEVVFLPGARAIHMVGEGVLRSGPIPLPPAGLNEAAAILFKLL